MVSRGETWFIIGWETAAPLALHPPCRRRLWRLTSTCGSVGIWMARVQQNLAWDPLVPVGSTGTKGRPFVSEHQSRLNFRDIYPLPTKPGLKPLSLPMEGAAVGGGGRQWSLWHWGVTRWVGGSDTVGSSRLGECRHQMMWMVVVSENSLVKTLYDDKQRR
jgi:hypothetical protein